MIGSGEIQYLGVIAGSDRSRGVITAEQRRYDAVPVTRHDQLRDTKRQ